MKNLKDILEGLLAGQDNILDTGNIVIKEIIEKFLKDNYRSNRKFKISDTPNKDGKYEVSGSCVEVRNNKIIKLTNDLFVWDTVTDFKCYFCDYLTSLEGAPKEVKRDFVCVYCKSIDSIEYAPKKVGNDFICHNNKRLFSKDEVENISNVSGKIIV